PGLPARAGAGRAGSPRQSPDARQGGAAPVSEPLWRPSPGRAAAAQINAFRAWCEPLAGRPLADTHALHAWSVADRAAFWSALWDWCEVVGTRGERALVDGDAMPGARWFPDARLNFAENLLRRRDVSTALVALDERGR